MRIAFTYSLKTAATEEQAEYDTPETVGMIEAALRHLGHDVLLIEASGSVAGLVAEIERSRPDLIFNTAEAGTGRGREAFYPSLFERLGIPYTGSDAYACTVTLDKHLTKLVVAEQGVRVPSWVFARRMEDVARCAELRFPVIVKPNFEGSSMGITAESVVEDRFTLEVRLAAGLARFRDGLMVEEYIAGRDVVVPYLELVSPETGGILEPAEYVYPNRNRRFSIFELEMKMRGFADVKVRVPALLAAEQRAEAMRFSRICVDVLGVRDLGRLDYRIDENGTLYFLEMNALPSLEPGASIYLSGQLAGLDGVEGVMERVIASAERRYALL